MTAQKTTRTTSSLLARAAQLTAEKAAVAANLPPPVLMADEEIRANLDQGVSPADVLAEMLERGELVDAAQERLDAVRGVGRVLVAAASTKPRIDIDDLFAGMPDAAVQARMVALELKCDPSVAALAMLGMASCALMGQVDVVLPPEAFAGGDEIAEILHSARSRHPYRAPLTTYLIISGLTGARKSEMYSSTGDSVLVGYEIDLGNAWRTKPGEAKLDPPKTRHSKATPAGLEIALMQDGVANIIADEGEDFFRAFTSGGDGKDQCGVLLTAKVGKYMSRTIAGDLTRKKALVVRTNNPRANILAYVQEIFFRGVSEEDRRHIERQFARGLWSRCDVAEWEFLTDTSRDEVLDAVRTAVIADRRIAHTARSTWETRLRSLLPPVRPNGDQHPVALSLGSISATLEPAAAAVVHRISNEHHLDTSSVRDFLSRAHMNVAMKAALLALLRQQEAKDVTVTLADVQRAERLVFGYLLPIYRRIRGEAASSVIEIDGDKVYETICRLAVKGRGTSDSVSTTEDKIKEALGRKGWGVVSDRWRDRNGKPVTRLEFGLQALERDERIVRRKIGKAQRVFPIGGVA